MTSLSQQPHSNFLTSLPPKDPFSLYQTQHTIGKGTFSKVKLGYNKQTHQKVAIKILDKSKISTKSDLERINREITFLKKLKHINIIKIYEIKETPNHYYIFMEYCDKGELFHYIVSKHKIEENEASYFFYQLINGLEYIHANNIVHRDLKPENLLLCKGDILKIIDFGLSNYYNGRLLKTPCGSPCYASPEMLSGQKYNGYCIDIWSTGIILYAMVCGYLPFEDKDNESLFRKIMKGDLRFPVYISECVKDLIRKILVVDPNKRIKLEEIKQHLFYMKGKDLFMRNHPEIGNVNLGLCISSLSNKVSVGKCMGMIGMKHEDRYIKKGVVPKKRNEVKVGIVNRNNKSNSYKRSTTVNNNNHHHYGTNSKYSPLGTEIGSDSNNTKYNVKVDNYLTTTPNTATRPSTTRTSLNINYDNINLGKPIIYNKTKQIVFNYHKTPKKDNKIYKPPSQHHIPTNTEINKNNNNNNNNNTNSNINNNKTTSYINNNFLTNRKLDNYLLFPSQAYKKKQACKHSFGDSDTQTNGKCLTELSYQQNNKNKFASQIQSFRESSIKTKQNLHINTSNNSNINSISSVSDNRTILNYNYINKESLSSKLSINNKTYTHNMNQRYSSIKNESNNSIVLNNPVIHLNMIEPKVFVNQRNNKRNNNVNTISNVNYNCTTQNSLKSNPFVKMNDNSNHLKMNTNVNYDGDTLNNNMRRRINFLNANIEKFNRKSVLPSHNSNNINKNSNTINVKSNRQIVSKKVYNTKNIETDLFNGSKIRSVSAKDNETNSNANNNVHLNNIGLNNVNGKKSFTSSFVDKSNINQGFVNLLTQLNNQLKNMKV